MPKSLGPYRLAVKVFLSQNTPASMTIQTTAMVGFGRITRKSLLRSTIQPIFPPRTPNYFFLFHGNFFRLDWKLSPVFC